MREAIKTNRSVVNRLKISYYSFKTCCHLRGTQRFRCFCFSGGEFGLLCIRDFYLGFQTLVVRCQNCIQRIAALKMDLHKTSKQKETGVLRKSNTKIMFNRKKK